MFWLFLSYLAVRTGIIYLLSAFLGSVVSALFVQNAPAVGSSGALFGLLGATLAGLIRNRKIYDNKVVSHPQNYLHYLLQLTTILFISAHCSGDTSICFHGQLLHWFVTICWQFLKYRRLLNRNFSWLCTPL